MIKDPRNFRKKSENFLNYIYLKTIIRLNFFIIFSKKIKNNLHLLQLIPLKLTNQIRLLNK